MSAAAKKPPDFVPTPYSSVERAALAAAIAANDDASARRVALEKAAQAANTAVLAAIGAVESAETALAEAGPAAIKHVVDKAMGSADAAPISVREARAAVIAAQDHLEECRATRAQLKTALEQQNHDFAQGRVTDAARAVIRSEVAAHGPAMAAEVAAMQRKIIEQGSGLEWLSLAGVFPKKDGKPVDDAIRHAVGRMEQTPGQWVIPITPREQPFAQPVGAQRWAAAFERLKTDPNAQLPEDL